MNRINGCAKNVSTYVDNKVSRGSSRTTKKPKVPNNVLDDKDLPHILWWKEVGPSTFLHLVKNKNDYS